MDWQMYLILFIAMILFIGIVLFAQRLKKQPKDPLSVWNPENFSPNSFHVAQESHFPHNHDDLLFDPTFRNLSVNVFHDNFRE